MIGRAAASHAAPMVAACRVCGLPPAGGVVMTGSYATGQRAIGLVTCGRSSLATIPVRAPDRSQPDAASCPGKPTVGEAKYGRLLATSAAVHAGCQTARSDAALEVHADGKPPVVASATGGVVSLSAPPLPNVYLARLADDCKAGAHWVECDVIARAILREVVKFRGCPPYQRGAPSSEPEHLSGGRAN